MNTERDLKDYPLNGNSGDEISKNSDVNSTEGQGNPNDEVKQIHDQAQVRASKIIADAQAAAQDQVDAMVRVAKAASEEAQKVIQSSREKAAIIEAESRREAEQILEDTKKRLEDQIRKDVKGPLDKLLTYMSDVEKNVQELGVRLEQWEVTAPPVVESAKENGSSDTETPPSKDSPSQQPAVDLKQPLGVGRIDNRGL